jgi:hypothetical protein
MIVVVIKREAADGAASFLGVSCLASETAGTERNAAAEPQTEARRCCGKSIAARDERAACKKRSAAIRALVTAVKSFGWTAVVRGGC